MIETLEFYFYIPYPLMFNHQINLTIFISPSAIYSTILLRYSYVEIIIIDSQSNDQISSKMFDLKIRLT
jgi:hypothetical protein